MRWKAWKSDPLKFFFFCFMILIYAHTKVKHGFFLSFSACLFPIQAIKKKKKSIFSNNVLKIGFEIKKNLER